MKSIGEQLQEGRAAKRWTLEAAAKATKIRADQLAELEADNYGKFASPAYARNFVRLYAKALELNERKITRQLDGILDDNDEVYVTAPPVEYLPEQVSNSQPFGAQRLGLYFIVALGGLFVVVCLITVVRMVKNAASTPAEPNLVIQQPSDTPLDIGTQPTPVPVAPLPTPIPPPTTPAPPAEPTPEPTRAIPAMSHKLVLKATDETWVRVTAQVDGQSKQLFEDTIPAGETREFTATRFTLKIACPATVLVNLDDKDFGPLSEDKIPQEFTLPSN